MHCLDGEPRFERRIIVKKISKHIDCTGYDYSARQDHNQDFESKTRLKKERKVELIK